jgi:hypothetical protein
MERPLASQRVSALLISVKLKISVSNLKSQWLLHFTLSKQLTFKVSEFSFRIDTTRTGITNRELLDSYIALTI